MHGNVWEWCQDKWHDSYKGAPIDGSAWKKQPSDNNNRIVRGGSWYNNVSHCHSAFRIMGIPNGYLNSRGLRLVFAIPK